MTTKGANEEGNRFIHTVIKETERNMAGLRNTLAGYLRNQERVRRKSLKLAVVLKMFSETEAPSLAEVLAGVSEKLTERELARENAMQRITLLSQDPIKLYSMICGRMKNEVKAREAAMKKEQQKQENLDKVVIKDGQNRSKINQLQLELTTAHQDTRTATTTLMDSMHRFEVEKRADLQKSLGQFIWNEMNFHAQALEILGEAHQLLLSEDIVELDLEDIEERILPAPSSPLRRGFVDDDGDGYRPPSAGLRGPGGGRGPMSASPRGPMSASVKGPMSARLGGGAGGLPMTGRRPSLAPQSAVPGHKGGWASGRGQEPARWNAKERRASMREGY
ncbi:hypothetical protein HKX48_000400 [Thoreauomyces humboldtii]|nr:hypothetical protein HKX48_000400 [Thoreauomyces humboldtii]